MPALAGDQDQRQAFGRLGVRLVQRGGKHGLFDIPPLGVEPVELFGESPRLGRIVRGQQPGA